VEAARRATPEDRPELLRLGGDALGELRQQRGGEMWLAHLVQDPVDQVRLDALLDDDEVEVVVGTVDDVPVGYAVARLEDVRVPATGAPGRVATIEQLYVEPAARAVGVGEALVEHVLAWARTHACLGVEGFALPGDRDTKNLFERFGLVARAILVFKSLEDDA
jgi:GNAT superfamily N-acetyltransferase